MQVFLVANNITNYIQILFLWEFAIMIVVDLESAF